MPLYIEKSTMPALRCEAVVTCRYFRGVRKLLAPKAGTATISAAPENGAYKIEVVPPSWKDADQRTMDVLGKCYRECLRLAAKKGCASVMLPLLTSADFPVSACGDFKIAVETITEFLNNRDLRVYLLVPAISSLELDSRYGNLEQYMLSNTGEQNLSHRRKQRVHWDPVEPVQEFDASASFGGFWPEPPQPPEHPFPDADQSLCRYAPPEASYGAAAPMSSQPAELKKTTSPPPPVCAPAPCPPRPSVMPAVSASRRSELDEMLRAADSGFSETLLRLIDSSGKKDSEIYNRANVSRQHFSKIRNNPDYRPTKPTAIAFAIALELDMDRTADLIGRAGYVLTTSSKFDLIIMYFIRRRQYDLFAINEALYAYDQSLLGA
jgi:hypothetical protein